MTHVMQAKQAFPACLKKNKCKPEIIHVLKKENK
jgi:hypothetical protein